MWVSVFTGRLEVLWVLLGEMAYVYYVVLRFRKGLPRLLALLPVFPPTFVIPWRAPTNPERCLYSFLFHWTIMSKLLLLVWDAGPVADPQVISSFPRFFSAMTFSLHLERDKRFISTKALEAAAASLGRSISAPANEDGKGSRIKNGTHSEESYRLVRRNAKSGIANDKNGEEEPLPELQRRAEQKKKGQFSFMRWIGIMVNSQAGLIVLLRIVFVYILCSYLVRTVQEVRHVLPIYILNLMLSFIIYFGAFILFESAAWICRLLLGTTLQPQFNMPFLADSLQDFWGRRWNLMINNLLRVSVYEPVLAFLIQRKEVPSKQKQKDKMKFKASAMDKAIAVLACFTVSGLEHELIFFHMYKSRPRGEMTAFFVLNGVATILEGLVKPCERLGMPRALGRVYTVPVVLALATWLFYPPILRPGTVDQSLSELRTFDNWIQGTIVGLLKS